MLASAWRRPPRRFHAALNAQPLWTPLLHPLVPQVANVLFVVANVLVLTSMARLGVTGTYLGDYFGILMKKRVTGFPFNVTENPMYNGATLNFLALALWWGGTRMQNEGLAAAVV